MCSFRQELSGTTAVPECSTYVFSCASATCRYWRDGTFIGGKGRKVGRNNEYLACYSALVKRKRREGHDADSIGVSLNILCVTGLSVECCYRSFSARTPSRSFTGNLSVQLRWLSLSWASIFKIMFSAPFWASLLPPGMYTQKHHHKM